MMRSSEPTRDPLKTSGAKFRSTTHFPSWAPERSRKRADRYLLEKDDMPAHAYPFIGRSSILQNQNPGESLS